MPVTLLETATPSALESPPRKRWTRAEVDLLDSLGLFAQQRLELIDGELINKMGKNSPHTIGVLILHEWLSGVFGFRQVQQEAPIDVAPDDNALNEPQPDLVVLSVSRTSVKTRNPRPENILLVIEVSDTTLSFDLKTKAPLYARAGIPEYWVLDVNKRQMIVHRDPAGDEYASVMVYREDESVTPLAAPQSALRVAAVFEE